MREGGVRPERPNVPTSSILHRKEEVNPGQRVRDAVGGVSPRKKGLSRDERVEIGKALVAAREQKPPVEWKDLARRYGLGRTRLWMLWQEAKKDVHEHLGATKRGRE
jgi:hypothetical protein